MKSRHKINIKVSDMLRIISTVTMMVTGTNELAVWFKKAIENYDKTVD
jgi:hypothetical protein